MSEDQKELTNQSSETFNKKAGDKTYSAAYKVEPFKDSNGNDSSVIQMRGSRDTVLFYKGMSDQEINRNIVSLWFLGELVTGSSIKEGNISLIRESLKELIAARCP